MDTTSVPSVAVQKNAPGIKPVSGPLLVYLMIALLFTAFLEALDNLIVTPALPRIASSLHGYATYTWVVTAYLLAATAAVPLAGKLSDQFGRKRFLISGIIIFLLGSGLAGVSQTMDQLIIFRALQGLGTGIGVGLVGAVVGDLFPPEQRASKQGLLGIVFGVSQLCGPTLGGWITDHGPLLSGFVSESTRWRWLFYLNVPIGLLALVVLALFLPGGVSMENVGRRAKVRIDWIGAILLVMATCSLLIGLSLGSASGNGWTSPQVLILLIAAAVFYAGFLAVERRAAEPIIPLDLFRKSAFAIDALQTVIQGMILIGVFIPLSLFLQNVLTLSPTAAGALMTALSLSLTLGAVLSGISITRQKRYQLTAIMGATLLTIGLFLLTFTGLQSSLLMMGCALVMIGLGAGCFFTIQMVVAQTAIPQQALGVGIGVIRYLSQLGMTLGAALMGLIVDGAIVGSAGASQSGSLLARFQLSGILHRGFWCVLVLSALLLLTTIFLKDVSVTSSPSSQGKKDHQPVKKVG